MHKKITLTDNRGKGLDDKGSEFTVKSLTNSTQYTIGQHISKAAVDALCRDRLWTVTIQGGAL